MAAQAQRRLAAIRFAVGDGVKRGACRSSVGCVAAKALYLVAGSRAGCIPEGRAGEVTRVGVPARVRRISVAGDGDIQRMVARITQRMAGPTQISAGREEEKEAIARCVGVVAHVAVLAQLAALDWVLAPEIIENVDSPLGGSAIVTAVAESTDGGSEAGRVVSSRSFRPEGLGVRILRDMALLTGRGTVGAQIVGAPDDIALLAGGCEYEGEGAGGGKDEG